MLPRWIALLSCTVTCALFLGLTISPAPAQSQNPQPPTAAQKKYAREHPYKKTKKRTERSHAKPKDPKRDAAVEGAPPPKK
jgi:hypothetical protein